MHIVFCSKPVFNSLPIQHSVPALWNVCLQCPFLMECHELAFDIQHFPNLAPRGFAFLHCNTIVVFPPKWDFWLSSSEPRKWIFFTPLTLILSCGPEDSIMGTSKVVRNQKRSKYRDLSLVSFCHDGLTQLSLCFLLKTSSSFFYPSLKSLLMLQDLAHRKVYRTFHTNPC